MTFDIEYDDLAGGDPAWPVASFMRWGQTIDGIGVFPVGRSSTLTNYQQGFLKSVDDQDGGGSAVGYKLLAYKDASYSFSFDSVVTFEKIS